MDNPALDHPAACVSLAMMAKSSWMKNRSVASLDLWIVDYGGLAELVSATLIEITLTAPSAVKRVQSISLGDG